MANKVQSWLPVALGRLISDINVMPLVDVGLVILIVFMITVPTMLKLRMQQERELDLQLPTATDAPEHISRITDLAISWDSRLVVSPRWTRQILDNATRKR